MARSDRGVTKEARDLADRVNALPGYEASIVSGGAHAGLAYVVRREGEYVARFSGHASYGGLALARAEAELRRRGVPLPRKDVTPKKEDLMPAPTREEKRLSDQLRPRVAAVLDRMGGDTTENRTRLSKQAADIVARNGGENFGGPAAASAPHEIAAASLKKFLDGGALKMVNLERWTEVERELASSTNGDRADARPEPEAAPAGADAEAEASLREERELRQVAESALEDAERERDEAKSLAEARENARASLVDQVENERRRADEAQEKLNEELEAVSFQRGRADRLEAELEKARLAAEQARVAAEQAEADPEVERKHEAQVRGYKGRIGSEQKRREEAEQAAREAELREAEAVGHLQEANDALGRAEERMNQLVREAEEARATLERLEREASSPAAQARAAVLRELEAAQGAPRPWVLERLDAMLGNDG